jgi:ESS family glutamate:Na+ symporter
MSLRDTINNVGDTLFFNLASLVGQYGFSLLFGALVLTPLFPYLHDGFASLLPAGFVGGYGSAAAFAVVLGQSGFKDALTIGYVSATAGVLIGIFGGMFMINIGTRRGWSRIVSSVEQVPNSMRTGFIPEKEQRSFGKETVSPISLDPITWHLSIILVISMLAFYIGDLVKILFPHAYQIPIFCFALFLSWLVQSILNMANIGQYIDRLFMHRIASFITDYLVAFGIASITLKIVGQFILPLIILFTFGSFMTVCLIWFIGRRICKNFWFERSLMLYGWNTGSIATSVVLLRVVDPHMHAKIIEDFSLAYTFIAFIEILIIAFVPHLLAHGIIIIPGIILIIMFFICLFLSKFFVGWFPSSTKMFREGEEKLIASYLNKNNK